MALPPWLVKNIPKAENIKKIHALLKDHLWETVCENAKCPNIGECYSKNTLTFMLLGNTCTRNCGFCAVPSFLRYPNHPIPQSPDPAEPKHIAQAVKLLNLKHIVITSVTRDDLPDGGASHFANTTNEIRNTINDVTIEVLIPDFQGSTAALNTVIAAAPDIINHNIETVPRLYSTVRPQADYSRSLSLIKYAKNQSQSTIVTKSGFMVGLGETEDEIYTTLDDLRAVDCDIVTIGQYLSPSRENLPVAAYITPEKFEKYHNYAMKSGFRAAHCGPLVRSSYKAGEIFQLVP